MSNTQRPTLTKQHTRKSEENRDDALNQGLRISLDGEVFEARVGDVTAEVTRELRRHTGMGFMRLIETCAADPDTDVISAFVWVARRINGDRVAFEDVAVSYADILSDGFDVDVPGAEVLDDSPEA